MYTCADEAVVMWSFCLSLPPTTDEVYVFARAPAFVRLSVCLSVSKTTQNACMDLDEMLRVNRCRNMDEIIKFWARSGSLSRCRNRIAFSHSVCTATWNLITSEKSHVLVSGAGQSSDAWFRGVETPLSEVNALYQVQARARADPLEVVNFWWRSGSACGFRITFSFSSTLRNRGFLDIC